MDYLLRKVLMRVLVLSALHLMITTLQSFYWKREQTTVLEGMLTAMYQSGAPASLWGEGENHLIFTLNNIPSQKLRLKVTLITGHVEMCLQG